MAWVKLDDQARQHRKILVVGPTAAWLWVCGLMYCNAQKAKDGFIPDAAVPVLYPIASWKQAATKLLAVGLWEKVAGGYSIHDYHDYQPTADEAEALSAKRREAGRVGGQKSAVSRRERGNVAEPLQTAKQVASFCSSKDPEANASKTKPVPIPIPIPSRERSTISLSSPPAAGVRAKRVRKLPEIPIPEAFGVTPELAATCRDEGLPSPHEVLPDFRDWALEKDVRRARWDLTFLRWMRDPRTRSRYRPWSESDPVNGRPSSLPLLDRPAEFDPEESARADAEYEAAMADLEAYDTTETLREIESEDSLRGATTPSVAAARGT